MPLSQAKLVDELLKEGSALQSRWLEFLGVTVPFITRVAGLRPANWAPVEHECYALRRAVERYYEYLTHDTFTVRTDSEPLVWLHTLRRPRGRMAE